MQGANHLAVDSQTGSSTPVRVTIVGTLGTGKSQTVNCLLNHEHAAKIGKDGSRFTTTKAFYEYRAAVDDQPELYRIKVVLLGQSEIESDLRHHLKRILHLREQDDKIKHSGLRQHLRDMLQLYEHDHETKHSQKAVSEMMNYHRTDRTLLAHLSNEQSRLSLSFESLYAKISDAVVDNLNKFPAKPSAADTLSFDTNAVDQVAWSAQYSTVWPFIHKVEVFCKHFPRKDLIITDCPGEVANDVRWKITMDHIISDTDILLSTHDYYDAMIKWTDCGYTSSSLPAQQIALVTGAVSHSNAIGWEFQSSESGTNGLSGAEIDQIENTRDQVNVAWSAYELSQSEVRSAGSLHLRQVWRNHAEGVRRIWKEAKFKKSEVHVMLRAKQAVLKVQARHGLRTGDVIRVFGEVYQKLALSNKHDGSDYGSEDDGEDNGFWTVPNTGIPELRSELDERMRRVKQSRADAVSLVCRTGSPLSWIASRIY